MSKQVDIVEIKTEPNEFVELFSDGENTVSSTSIFNRPRSCVGGRKLIEQQHSH